MVKTFLLTLTLLPKLSFSRKARPGLVATKCSAECKPVRLASEAPTSPPRLSQRSFNLVFRSLGLDIAFSQQTALFLPESLWSSACAECQGRDVFPPPSQKVVPLSLQKADVLTLTGALPGNIFIPT